MVRDGRSGEKHMMKICVPGNHSSSIVTGDGHS